MLGKKVKFKKAKLPSNQNLNGKYVILEPLNTYKHSRDLYRNFSKDKKDKIWIYLPYGPFKNYKNFKKWLESYCLNNDPFFYAIFSKRHNQYCGMASYLRVTPRHGSIEVGHINFSPLLQKTTEGTEAMYILMKHAFEVLGNRRYEWKCNNLNTSSKNSAIRLGFKFEGIFRQMYIFKGRNRDTAWFSILDKEWEKLKRGYIKFLSPKNFDKNLKQKTKLIIKSKKI